MKKTHFKITDKTVKKPLLEMLPYLYLAEVHVDVFSGLLMKLCATNLLSKVSNANGVAGVELLDKEITASLDHAVYLVHDGAVHHVYHTLLPYGDAGRVGELYESLHYLCGCERKKDRGRWKWICKKRVKEREEKGKYRSEVLFMKLFISSRKELTNL